MRCTVKRAPSGLLNGLDWPAVGEPIDLPDHVAEGMIRAGHLERATDPEPEPEPVVETAKLHEPKVETATPAKPVKGRGQTKPGRR